MIHIDSREPKVMQALVTSLVSGDTHVLALESADYLLIDLCGHSLGVERKAIQDFLSSLAVRNAQGDKRLYSQLDRVVRTYDYRLLVLEGLFDVDPGTRAIRAPKRGNTRWSHAAMQMALLGVQVRFGVQVLWTPSQFGTADTLRVLHERARKGCLWPQVRVKMRDGSDAILEPDGYHPTLPPPEVSHEVRATPKRPRQRQPQAGDG